MYERAYEFSVLSTSITSLEWTVFPSAGGLIVPLFQLIGDPLPLKMWLKKETIGDTTQKMPLTIITINDTGLRHQ